MSLAAPPMFADIDPNGTEFREALAIANIILAGTKLNVYSRHTHPEVEIKPGRDHLREARLLGQARAVSTPRDRGSPNR